MSNFAPWWLTPRPATMRRPFQRSNSFGDLRFARGSNSRSFFRGRSAAGQRCNDCHTAPPYTSDPEAYLGAPKQINLACYLAGGTPFGPFVSRDITPWEDGKPAGLTLKGFVHVLRTGEDPDHPGQVLHVMPWPVYQTMTDHDLRAVYEYLSSIPAIPPNTCGVPSER